MLAISKCIIELMKSKFVVKSPHYIKLLLVSVVNTPFIFCFTNYLKEYLFWRLIKIRNFIKFGG